MDALSLTRPKISDVQEDDARALINRRLARATQGKLRVPVEVKSIRNAPDPVTMFEIRWDELLFARYNTLGILVSSEEVAHLRLYFVEQPSDGDWVLGLHTHEKVILTKADAAGNPIFDPDETEKAQDAQIDIAVDILEAEAGSYCGVPALAKKLGASSLIRPSDVV